MTWHHGGMGAGGWIVMGVSMVLFWTVVVLLVLTLIRYLNRAPHRHPHVNAPDDGHATTPSAQQILAERYARGDIDEDEYQRRARTLREAGS